MCQVEKGHDDSVKFEEFLAAQTLMSSAYGETNIKLIKSANSAAVFARTFLLQGEKTMINVWNEMISPENSAITTQAEREVDSLVKKIGTLTSLIHRQNIYNRIIELIALLQEEKAIINNDSLECFYKFLRLNPKLKLPSITLSPDNEIYTSWEINEDKLFDIQFLNQNNVKFVLFTPSAEKSEDIIRLSGITKAHSIIAEVAKPLGVLKWISE